MERANLIFLDFDGVLNDPYWLENVWPARRNRRVGFEFDLSRLEILQRICDKTNAKLVLASSWNYRPGVQQYFGAMGFKVVGQLGRYADYSQPRGEAIKEWFRGNPGYSKANYIILDDEKPGYDENQLQHLVFTGSDAIDGWTEGNIYLASRHIGLDKSHIEEALKLLEVKNEQPLSKS